VTAVAPLLAALGAARAELAIIYLPPPHKRLYPGRWPPRNLSCPEPASRSAVTQRPGSD
jgi:hypothetical protein